MVEFLEFLSNNEMPIVIGLIATIVFLLFAILIIEITSKKKSNVDNDEELDINDGLDKTNINASTDGVGMLADETALDRIDVETVTKNLEKTGEIEEIKYVEEDEELEKTKARLELETLKRELAKMEQEEKIEVNDAVVEIKEEPVEEVKKEPEEPKSAIVTSQEPVIENVEEKVPTMEEEVEMFESSQEEHAIISVDELMKASENITDEEIEEYEDDGNEPISIKELEALYKSVEEPVKVEIKVEEENKTTLPEFDLKVKPASEAYEGKEFKNSSVISPVFGLKTTEESIMLEQTANLDKLNEEIRKTNEFLSALKELRKNLE